MLNSTRSSIRTPVKGKVSSEVLRAALEREAQMTKYRAYWHSAMIWTSISAFLLLEVCILGGVLLDWLLGSLLESDYINASSIEWPLLVICALNAIYCLFVALRSSLGAPHNAFGKLSQKQMTLLGLTDKEWPLLVICALNAIYCLFVALRSSLGAPHNAFGKLSQKQMTLLGLTDKEYLTPPAAPRPSPKKVPSNGVSPSTNQKFCSDWLSALRFDSPSQRSVESWHKEPGSPYMSPTSNNTSMANDSSFYGAPSPMNVSTYSDRESAATSPARLSHNSSYSKPSTSIQTNKQLDKLIANSPLLSSSPLKNNASLLVGNSSYLSSQSKNTSYGSFYSNRPKDYGMYEAESSVYDLGTALNGDNADKSIMDENGVVSSVSGNRLSATASRVSLSPISLNQSSGQMSGNEHLEGRTSTNIASVSRTRADQDESISFRVAVNAQDKSPKRSARSPSPLTRRSDSWERRRASSISQQRSSIDEWTGPGGVSQGINITQMQSSGSPSPVVSKQLSSFASSEILNQYKLDAERFGRAERNLRVWICQTIVRPLVANINKMNKLLSKDYPQLHLKIGQSSIDALKVALSTKSDLLCTVLPYLIPYLKAHDKQAYIVKRAAELSQDVCMKEFNWHAGGAEPVDKANTNPQGYTPSDSPWNENLPTDAQLIWSWFCTYLDARLLTSSEGSLLYEAHGEDCIRRWVMLLEITSAETKLAANPMASDVNTPFSSVYYLKKPLKPSTVQCCSDSFYVHQTSVSPPHFELVTDGGRERFEVGRGMRNLWRTIVLFIQHVRLFNNARLGNISIDESGINAVCIVDNV